MPYIILTKIKGQTHDKTVKAKIHDFLEKLSENDETVGLHIENMQHPVDPRARTGRVDQGLRAVLYRLETSDPERTYVYAGTFDHDTAIARARGRKLKINPVNGVPELIEVGAPEEETHRSATPPVAPSRETEPQSFLEHSGYLLTDLTDELGFDRFTATRLWSAEDDEQLMVIAESLDNEWQTAAVLGLAVVDAVHKIKEDLDLVQPARTITDDAVDSDDDLVEAFKHPAAQMQFTFVGDDQEELRRVIEGDDFGAWRVFLHPEQRRYVARDFNGPFRLTGGAGTGKTVVLLHRARALAQRDPQAKVVLTTFTKALGRNLVRDLERLDSDIHLSDSINLPGVSVRGIDQLAAAVRDAAGPTFGAAAESVLGRRIESARTLRSNADGWRDAIDEIEPDLPDPLLSETFFEGEYLQVVLPQSVTTREEYFGARRPGRGVALDRRKRGQVWSVIERFRKTARMRSELNWAELSSIAAAWLRGPGAISSTFVDHILVDEGQDLTPSRWQLIRAIAREGKNDIFIADDSHQRIYGRHVVLSRFGIKVVGRSRRLTLNYRTTEQNLRFAMQVLSGADYVDAGGEQETNGGYRSARRGPEPTVIEGKSQNDQLDAITDLVQEWVSDDVTPETVAILVRFNNDAILVLDALGRAGIPSALLKGNAAPSGKVLVMTMHTAKGMEFSRVVPFDISEGTFPPAWLLDKSVPEEQDDLRLRWRSLLYVAASRARDALVVSWSGEPSHLIVRGESDV